MFGDWYSAVELGSIFNEDTLDGLRLPASADRPPAKAEPAIAFPFLLIRFPRIPFFPSFSLTAYASSLTSKAFPFEFTQDIDVARMYARCDARSPTAEPNKLQSRKSIVKLFGMMMSFLIRIVTGMGSALDDRLVGASRPLISTPVIIDVAGRNISSLRAACRALLSTGAVPSPRIVRVGALSPPATTSRPSLIRLSDIGIT